MQQRILVFTMVIATTLAGGCAADPRAASKENFARAIDATLGAKSELCLYDSSNVFADTMMLPYRILSGPLPQTLIPPQDAKPYDAVVRGQLEPLVSVGLLTKRMATVQAEHIYEYNRKPRSMAVRVTEYDAGPQFAKYFSRRAAAPNSVASLCFAHLQVDHVDNYSEPGQMMGATVSEVQYHAKVVGVADWAAVHAIQSAFPTIKQQLEEATQAEKTATVVLMNNGWQAQ